MRLPHLSFTLLNPDCMWTDHDVGIACEITQTLTISSILTDEITTKRGHMPSGLRIRTQHGRAVFAGPKDVVAGGKVRAHR